MSLLVKFRVHYYTNYDLIKHKLYISISKDPCPLLYNYDLIKRELIEKHPWCQF